MITKVGLYAKKNKDFVTLPNIGTILLKNLVMKKNWLNY